jgi:phosphopantetheinyl transferase
LLSALRQASGILEGVSSKAHSRAAAAVAVAADGPIGIDIEYRDPERAIVDIARWLGVDTADARTAYRVFTFREAYFKAFGVWPEKLLLRDVSTRGAAQYRIANACVLHEDAGSFLLTLVWRGSAPPIRVRA